MIIRKKLLMRPKLQESRCIGMNWSLQVVMRPQISMCYAFEICKPNYPIPTYRDWELSRKRSVWIILLACLLVCGNVSYLDAAGLYTEDSRPFLDSLRSDDTEAAFAAANSFVSQTIKSGKDRQNKYLALLERGKVALSAGKYDQCIADLQEAEKRFLLIEGTFSLAEGFGSIITDDTAQEYEAEMHEKIMISPYLALAYLGKGDFAGARVERNRTINKINQYIETNPEERGYLENPFARLLSAIMYEMENKPDDAAIEYKKMKRAEDAARLSVKRQKSTDLVIFIDTGLAPHKYQIKWGPMPVTAGSTTVQLGFAYASYEPTSSEIAKNEISIDGKPAGDAALLYDLGKTILTQYEKDKAAILAKLVTRMTTKASVQASAQAAADKVARNSPMAGLLMKTFAKVSSAVWMAVEQADLRGWLTLPRQIHYLRVNGLTPGEHTLKIDYGCGVQEKKVRLEKDKIGIAYFSFAK